jgi:hypothetical protein
MRLTSGLTPVIPRPPCPLPPVPARVMCCCAAVPAIEAGVDRPIALQLGQSAGSTGHVSGRLICFLIMFNA